MYGYLFETEIPPCTSLFDPVRLLKLNFVLPICSKFAILTIFLAKNPPCMLYLNPVRLLKSRNCSTLYALFTPVRQLDT